MNMWPPAPPPSAPWPGAGGDDPRANGESFPWLPASHQPRAPWAERDVAEVDTVRTAAISTMTETQPATVDISTVDTLHAPALPYGDRSLADRDTAPRRVVQRAGRLRPSGAKVWLGRVGLALGLLLLGARAGYASLALMAPGGILQGWTITPPTVCALCGVNPTVEPNAKPLTPSEYAALLTSKLSLNDELGQMMIVQYVGPGMTPDALQMVNQQNVGGVLLKAANGNVESVDQIKGLTAQLQANVGNGIPLLMSIDQEGGCCGLNRLEAIAGPLPGVGDLSDPAAATAEGARVAGLLHQYGFNLNLAPVVDVCQNNRSICFRTFGSDPARVAAMAGAYIDGFQQSGQVTACLKHFPGLGAATGNPDLTLPYVYSTKAQWEQTDLAPFRALLATGNIRAIMVTHVMVPAVDPNLPATLSPTFITDVLRGELGFTGAIITDDLFDISQYGQYTVPQAAVLSVKAGTDILIGAYAPGEKAGGATVAEMRDALAQAIQSGQLSRQRIDDAVTHILTLKIQMGLIQMPHQGRSSLRDNPMLQGDAESGALVAWLRSGDA